MQVLYQIANVQFIVKDGAKFYHVNFETNKAFEIRHPAFALRHGYWEDPNPTQTDIVDILKILRNNKVPL